MRFSDEFIQQTREAQGDEAADQLMMANREDSHRELLASVPTLVKDKYPRVERAVKMGAFSLPPTITGDGLDAYLASQEEHYTLMGVSPTDAPAVPPPPIVEPPASGTNVSAPPGSQPWIVPGTPGVAPPTEAVVESELRDLMEGEGIDGSSSRADLARRRALVGAIEIANQQPNGIALIEGVRSEYEDQPMFLD